MECLDERALQQLADGALPQAQAAAARGHLETCGACAQRAAALAVEAARRQLADEEPTGRLDASAPLSAGPREPLARGTSLGRYLLLERMGAGGMGEVYAAFDPQLNRKVALKLLLPAHDARKQEEERLRLLREAQAMARLSHPNVIPVYDIGELGDQVFIAMELVEGVTLRQWVKEGVRPWREVVGVLSAAGRGLAAAHAAGLVHRDFKPDNVLVGRDGRVHVLDFGIACAQNVDWSSERSAGARAGPGVEEATGEDHLETPVTRAGVIMGTPGYMAPEQYRGEAADARADQFSFCATLAHALYGEPAFTGRGAAALCREAMEGRVRPAPAGTRVPGWVRQVVLRGLSPERKRRFPSMEALLEALQQDPAVRRRRQGVAALAGVVLVAAAAGAWQWRQQRLTVCQGQAARLAGVWDAQRQQGVEAAFRGTGVPYAGHAWTTVHGLLDAYAQAWVAQATEACEATRLRGEASERVLSLRTGCLEQRRGELRALTDVFAAADREVVEQAVSAAGALPELAVCADVDFLANRIAPPADAGVAARVEALRTRLAQARALWMSGKYEAGLQVVQPLLAEAQALEYLPLEAEVLLQLGRLQESFGNPKEGERTLKRATWRAEEAHHDEVRAGALVALTSLVGYNAARAAEAHDLYEAARALLTRTRQNGRLQSELDSAHGLAFASEGRFREGEAAQRAALVTLERSAGLDNPDVAVVLRRLANTLTAQGRHEEALGVLERAHGLFRARLGGEHPRVGSTLVSIGTALSSLGRHAEALPRLEEGMALVERTLLPRHPYRGLALQALAQAQARAAQPSVALATLRRALEASEAARGREHPDVALASSTLGAVLVEAGRPAEALAPLSRALAIQERSLPPHHPALAATLTGLGEAQARLGHADEAAALLERALRIREASEGPPVDLAHTRFALARALAGRPETAARAEQLARQADAALAVPGGEALLAEVRAWLASHAPRS